MQNTLEWGKGIGEFELNVLIWIWMQKVLAFPYKPGVVYQKKESTLTGNADIAIFPTVSYVY